MSHLRMIIATCAAATLLAALPSTDASGAALPGFLSPFAHVGSQTFVAPMPGPQGDGDLVIAGIGWACAQCDNRISLRAFDAGGAPITSFGTGGVAAQPHGLGELFTVAAVRRPGGGYVALAERVVDSELDRRETLVAFTASGAVDTSWATAGVAAIDLYGHGEQQEDATALATCADGSIAVVGAHTDAGSDQTYVEKLTPTGQPDPAFGTAARLRIRRFYAHSATCDASGSVLLVGNTEHGYMPRGLLMRLTPSGSPDPTFGQAGRAGIPGFRDARLTTLTDGRHAIAGDATAGAGVAILDAADAIDTAFGRQGIFTLQPPGLDVTATDVRPLADGTLMIAGVAHTENRWSNSYMGDTTFVAHVRAGGSLDPRFGFRLLDPLRFAPGSDDEGDTAPQLAATADGTPLLVTNDWWHDTALALRLNAAPDRAHPTGGNPTRPRITRLVPRREILFGNVVLHWSTSTGRGASVQYYLVRGRMQRSHTWQKVTKDGLNRQAGASAVVGTDVPNSGPFSGSHRECFEVRAVDALLRQSQWSRARCFTVPHY